jgi:hypothetical protein
MMGQPVVLLVPFIRRKPPMANFGLHAAELPCKIPQIWCLFVGRPWVPVLLLHDSMN